MITLTQFAASPLCAEIRRALRFKGVEFQAFEWPIAELGALGLQAESATGGLPILQIDGGEKIRDTATILLELESRFQRPPLVPEVPSERAQAMLLEGWASQGLYFYGLAARFSPQEVDASIQRVLVSASDVYEAAREIIVERLQKVLIVHGLGTQSAEWLLGYLQRLTGAVEDLQQKTGFVVGSTITIADIAIASQLTEIGRTAVGRQILESRPALAEYVRRIDQLAPSD